MDSSLDDFLKQLVAEFGDSSSSWPKIAEEFQSIAADLEDEDLQQSAEEQYSAFALQRRWVEITQSEEDNDLTSVTSSRTTGSKNYYLAGGSSIAGESQQFAVDSTAETMIGGGSTTPLLGALDDGTNDSDLEFEKAFLAQVGTEEAKLENNNFLVGTGRTSTTGTAAAAAAPVDKSASESHFNPHFPSFATALLAYGVNPHDPVNDTRCLIELKDDQVRPKVFDSILEKLKEEKDMSVMETLSRQEFTRLLNPNKKAGEKTGAEAEGEKAAGEKKMVSTSGGGKSGPAIAASATTRTSGSAASKPTPQTAGGKGKGKQGRGTVDTDEHDSSDANSTDSEDNNFQQARANLKAQALEKVGKKYDKTEFKAPAPPISFQPPSRTTTAAAAAAKQTLKNRSKIKQKAHQEFGKLSEAEELLVSGGFSASGFVDKYDHYEDLSEAVKQKVDEIESIMHKKGVSSTAKKQTSLAEIQTCIAEDKEFVRMVEKVNDDSAGPREINTCVIEEVEEEQNDRNDLLEQPRPRKVSDSTTSSERDEEPLSPEQVAVNKGALLQAEHDIDPASDTKNHNLEVQADAAQQQLLANLRKMTNPSRASKDQPIVQKSREQQRREDEEEKKRFAEEVEERRKMLQERMRGLDMVLEPSSRVAEHMANLQVTSSKNDVIVKKMENKETKATTIASSVEENKENNGEDSSNLSSSENEVQTASWKTSAKSTSKAAAAASVDLLNKSKESSASEQEVEFDVKMLDQLVKEKYDYPLTHFAGSKASKPSLLPINGFLGQAMAMNQKFYLLPFSTEERPVVSEKSLQLLQSSVAVCNASVLLLIDGQSIPNEAVSTSMSFYGLYLLIAAPERVVLQKLQQLADQSDSEEERARNYAKEAFEELENSGDFIPIDVDKWHPLVTSPFGFGPNLVGSYASSGDAGGYAEKLDRHYSATDVSLSDKQFYEQSCAVVVKNASLLGELILQALRKGLYVCALRTVYLTEEMTSIAALDSPAGHIPSILKHHLDPKQKNIVIAFRGPDCVELIREIVGPSPEIARRTDPKSLNARFGAMEGNEHVVSPPARGVVDLVWAFGGRVEDLATFGEKLIKPNTGTISALQRKSELENLYRGLLFENTEKDLQFTYAFHVFPEQVFSIGLRHALSPSELIPKIELYLRHVGKVLSVNPQKKKFGAVGTKAASESANQQSSFVITAVREAGAKPLERIEGLQSHHVFSEIAMDSYGMKIRNLPQQFSYETNSGATGKEEDPNEIVVTMLPLLGNEDLKPFAEICELSIEELEEQSTAGASSVYGGGLDLISLRIVDLKQIDPELTTTTEYFLRSPLLSEAAKQSVVLFAVYRGEKCFEKIENFIFRKSKAVYAGQQGRWKFTKLPSESFYYFNVFFGLKSFFGASSVLPSFPLTDVRSNERYRLTKSRFEAKKMQLWEEGSSGGGGMNAMSGLMSGQMKSSTRTTFTNSVVAVDPDSLFNSSSDNDEVAATYFTHSPKSKSVLSSALQVKGPTAFATSLGLGSFGGGAKKIKLLQLVGEEADDGVNFGDQDHVSITEKFGKNIAFVLIEERFLSRSLRILKQNGFSVKNLVKFLNKVPHELKKMIWEQDCKQDGYFKESDRGEWFDKDVKAFWLLQLYRGENCCKKLAKLCGHGDPKENARKSYVSLRKGKSRTESGVYCTSSAEFVKQCAVLLLQLESDQDTKNEILLEKTNTNFPLRMFATISGNLTNWKSNSRSVDDHGSVALQNFISVLDEAADSSKVELFAKISEDGASIVVLIRGKDLLAMQAVAKKVKGFSSETTEITRFPGEKLDQDDLFFA
ncbi:unnamed protein product [Amoebophrya sp. A120]|nr:unnamed protein product [Amoebophrya sp. A120]|eukprot:GSA120T00014171001.1